MADNVELVDVIQENTQITASDVEKKLDISCNACSTRDTCQIGKQHTIEHSVDSTTRKQCE
jgi:hypothetical protein